ncbi:hypothetical protein KCP73_19105 [Salmonella enterica subsp. enterica]|nr:hypothetical protein KCP73_19105 [Salmonella enterica subsp. enterica]
MRHLQSEDGQDWYGNASNYFREDTLKLPTTITMLLRSITRYFRLAARRPERRGAT